MKEMPRKSKETQKERPRIYLGGRDTSEAKCSEIEEKPDDESWVSVINDEGARSIYKNQGVRN